ncbi:MAG TPA: shikimate dehydrogenase [Verrucomicrobiales bacterium]|nr:shikimate dehydrogenase [Verrucomicrobiales bacterium]
MAAELNFKQELVGCFGYPVAENPTQAMIEPAFRDMGLDWRYLTLEVKPEDLPAAVAGARAFGFQGFNCTIPHKVAVIHLLDGLGESAALMGAVNCVVNREGRFIGENTDGKGFVSSFRELADPAGKSLVLLGAGGAARAIGVEMALAGVTKITLINRGETRGRELEALFTGPLRKSLEHDIEIVHAKWDGDFRVPEDTNILVNATSMGLFPDVDARIPLEMDSISKEMIVADVIPNPPSTRLVREAREKGCRVIDGLGMLVAQGVIGIEYWTGRTPDAGVMRRGLEAVFG